MTAVDKLIRDFKLLDDIEKAEAIERQIIIFHPMNVCAKIRTLCEDDDAVCKPILRRVTKYIGRFKNE